MNKRGTPENLRPIDNSDPKINEAKSRGKIRASAERNILAHIRTNIKERGIIENVFGQVEEEIAEGNLKNAIELIKIAREPDKLDLDVKMPESLFINVIKKEEE